MRSTPHGFGDNRKGYPHLEGEARTTPAAAPLALEPLGPMLAKRPLRATGYSKVLKASTVENARLSFRGGWATVLCRSRRHESKPESSMGSEDKRIVSRQ